MNLRPALLAPALALLLAACGDGPGDSPADPTAPGSTAAATTPAGGTPAATPGLGPSPDLGTYILSVAPAHGQEVKPSYFRPGDPLSGICFEANFEKTPEYAQWFRMAVDGREVTTELTWLVPTKEAPTKGKACYSPPTPLTPGRHEAAVSVQSPKNLAQPPLQTIGWRFDVVP
ncbi:hypothetical protein EDM76_06635 [bacterium]|nr:MAG: hypothetical protein EDM76_06635 [bacterium]MBE7520372.1 hypothetical protein [Thermoflexaceae bacterium]MCL4232568.1 hypothetical protein [Dehalococcoidia bacterium]